MIEAYFFWWRFWLAFWKAQTRLPPPPLSCQVTDLARWRADHPPGKGGRAA